MKIAFSKISSVKYPFKLDFDNLTFEGFLKRLDTKLVELDAVLKGHAIHFCDSCGEELELVIDENIKLNLSDGMFKDKENELSDTMEFFDNEIDLIEVLKSELGLYLSDYFYCKKCE